MAAIKYKQYTEEELNKDIGEDILFLFEYGSLKFGVICQLKHSEYFGNSCYLAFYAMSKGFEEYTGTGFKSNFVSSGDEIVLKDVEQYFLSALLECGIDVHNPKPVLSRVNEVAELQQLTFF